MRIVSKPELMQMSTGTLFADYRPETPWPEGPSMIFVQPCGDNDFLYRSINFPDADSSEAVWELTLKMEADGRSEPVDLSIAREGMYEPRSLYLVWEPDDVRRIINVLQGGNDEKDD